MNALQIRKTLLSGRIGRRMAWRPKFSSRGRLSAVAARGRVANLRVFAALALVTGPLALFAIWATRWVRERRVLVSVDNLGAATAEPA
jgi:hypothetical protein